jgi:hypothetical protein
MLQTVLRTALIFHILIPTENLVVSWAISLVLNIWPIRLGLDLAIKRNIIKLAVAPILVSKALASRISKTNSTAASICALCLGSIGIVVLGDVLGNGTTNSLREGKVGVDRLTSLDTGCDIEIEEKTGAATVLTDAEGLACGVLGAEALVVAGFRGAETSQGLEGRGSDVGWDVAHDAGHTTDGLFAFDRERAGDSNGREDGGNTDELHGEDWYLMFN